MPKTGIEKEMVAKSRGTKFQWPRLRMPHKYVIYDKFHRATVFCLVSASVIMIARICVDVAHHYRVRNPIMHEMARLDKEAKMEEMQKEREEAINLQRKLQEEANKV